MWFIPIRNLQSANNFIVEFWQNVLKGNYVGRGSHSISNFIPMYFNKVGALFSLSVSPCLRLMIQVLNHVGH